MRVECMAQELKGELTAGTVTGNEDIGGGDSRRENSLQGGDGLAKLSWIGCIGCEG